MKQNNFAAAQTSADMAKNKADEAAKAARPEYEHSEQHKSDKARTRRWPATPPPSPEFGAAGAARRRAADGPAA